MIIYVRLTFSDLLYSLAGELLQKINLNVKSLEFTSRYCSQ